MWGFVSIMLALLFMFLPGTTDTPRSVSVDRATAWHSSPQRGAQKEDAILVSIIATATYFSAINLFCLGIGDRDSRKSAQWS